MMPEAVPRDVAGMRWATAPSKTEKLQAQQTFYLANQWAKVENKD